MLSERLALTNGRMSCDSLMRPAKSTGKANSLNNRVPDLKTARVSLNNRGEEDRTRGGEAKLA